MSYSFQCSLQNGFVPNPLHPQRVGYLTDFNGLGLSAALAKDLSVPFPYNNAAPVYTPIDPVNNKVNVTAVLDTFSWNGGVGDPLNFSCYISNQNFNQLRLLTQTVLKTTSISAFGWWIADYDQNTKQWFEQVYPVNPQKPSGQLNTPGNNSSLQIDNVSVQAAPGINVYKIFFAIVPTVNQMAAISLATAPTIRLVKEWGLVVGKIL